MNGFGRSIYKDGRCHIGYYKDDERNGYGKKIYASGNIYYGYFKDGKRSGYGKFVFKNGNSEEGYSHDDKLNGFAKVIENGCIKQGIYKDEELVQEMDEDTFIEARIQNLGKREAPPLDTENEPRT